jgi:hypothetical protein
MSMRHKHRTSSGRTAKAARPPQQNLRRFAPPDIIPPTKAFRRTNNNIKQIKNKPAARKVKVGSVSKKSKVRSAEI